MKAGQSNLEVGTRVRIKNLKGVDKWLNGRMGTVTHPFAFGCTDKGWVGVWVDAGVSPLQWGGKCNVREDECEIITEAEIE